MRTSSTLPLVFALVAAQFVVMLDSSILNVALPSIAADLGLSPVGTAWVLNAYFLTFGGLLLISGRAADVLRAPPDVPLRSRRAGRRLRDRRVLPTTETMLIAARLVQEWARRC